MPFIPHTEVDDVFAGGAGFRLHRVDFGKDVRGHPADAMEFLFHDLHSSNGPGELSDIRSQIRPGSKPQGRGSEAPLVTDEIDFGASVAGVARRHDLIIHRLAVRARVDSDVFAPDA